MDSTDVRTPTIARGATLARALVVALVAVVAAACSSGSAGNGGVTIGGAQSANDPVSPDYPIAYIKRTLPDPADPNARMFDDDLRVQRVWNGPADVWLRDRASPSGAEKNVTGAVTQGQWDVRDLASSYDGKKLIFSMRKPLLKNARESQQPKWTLYEYDLTTSTLRQVISDPIVAAAGHDVAPQYLPDGRIVFSSTRQRDAKAVLIDEGKEQFDAGIEGNRNLPAFNLHVMSADGSSIRQISFNTAHDLNPTVLPDGRVLFTRWDLNAGAGMHLYTINPDGSGLQLLYGRNSHATGTAGSTVQFVQGQARPDGKVVALMRPFANVDFGGDPVLIDVQGYVENTQPVLSNAGGPGPAQSRMVVNDVRTTAAPANAPRGTRPPPSPGGRYMSVYPLWDGTGRLLVSWTQCRLVDAGRIVPCTEDELAKTGVTPAAPLYGIFIYDPAQNTQLPVVAPVEGVMFTEAVAFQPRSPLPASLQDAVPGVQYPIVLQAENVGILDIRSVYDFDGTDTTPNGIAAMRDPARTTWDRRPARFLRIEKAVSLPNNEVLPNNRLPATAFGAAGGFMRELIGYAPVEPDGSVRVKVPAHIPVQISLVDASGKRLAGSPIHRNWLQLRVGEVVSCNGCHVQQAGQNGAPSTSHGRPGLFAAANPGAPASGQPFPNTQLKVPQNNGALAATAVLPNQGETMAQYRARAQLTCLQQPCAASPSVDLVFDDVWSTTPAASFAMTYAQLTTASPASPTCGPVWQANCRSTIHYPRHVGPMFTTARTTITAVNPATMTPYTACTDCHSQTDAANQRRVPAGQLDLVSTPDDTTQRMRSFEQLLNTHPALALNMGALQPMLVPGPPDPVTGQPTQVPLDVQPPMSGAGASASPRFFSKFAPGGSHAGWLTPAELKLIAEWLDLGGQYYNDPFAIPQ